MRINTATASVSRSNNAAAVVHARAAEGSSRTAASQQVGTSLRGDSFQSASVSSTRAVSTQSERVHTVRPGETLSGIARQYGTTVQAIATANGITNPDRIQVGQRLRIPGSSTSPTPGPTPGPTPVGPGVANSVQQANRVFLTQWGGTAFNSSNGAPYGYNDCGPTSGAMALAQLGLISPAAPHQASATIDRVRDAALGYNSNHSQRMTTTQLASGLRAMGARTNMLSGPVTSAVDQALARGNPVILGGYGAWSAWGSSERAAGNYLNPRNPGGHFVTVLGKTPEGQYLVGDPLVRGGTLAVSAQQLQTFYGNNGFGILEVSRPQ